MEILDYAVWRRHKKKQADLVACATEKNIMLNLRDWIQKF